MKEESKKTLNLFLRYLILVLIALPGLDIFYAVFLPLTKYPVFWFLQIFLNPILSGDVIHIGAKTIEIIGACVAGSAYYLLLILNLGTPNIKPLLRVKMILFSFLGFLVVNIIRIIILSFMYIANSSYFGIIHETFWYLGSTVLIVFIWFLEVKIFGIKGIPFYTDLKTLYKSSTLKKK